MTDLEAILRRSVPPPAPGAAARAAARLAAAAEERGLLDVAYVVVPSPVGDLVAAGTARGLVALEYEDGRLEAILERLAARVSPRVLEAPARLDPARRQLDEYFARRRRAFELPLDWALVRGF